MTRPPPDTPATSDHALLRAYTTGGDQQAFTHLVHRHVDMVYAAARRQVAGDRDLAQDVTQAVFLLLAERARAGRIGPTVLIPGWLYTTTRYAAANARRAAQHRKRHERKAALMSPSHTPAAMTDEESLPAWAQLAPHIDAALARLATSDRNAVLLKYIQGKSHHDVGAALGISEEAARKRVSRALDRLRTLLLRRDLALPAATLATLLTAHATEAAPLSLSAACAVAPPTTTLALAKSTLSTVAWIKAKLIAACLATAAVLTTTTALTVHHFTAAAQHPAPTPLLATPVLALAAPPPAPPPPADLSKIDATLRTPDDAPAAGADVYVVMPEDPAVLREQRAWQAKMMANPRGVTPPPPHKDTAVKIYDPTWPDGTVTTDATGHFSFANLKEPWILVARHETGFVQLTHEQFKKSPTDVYLQPWARVEGTLRVGKEPQVNQKIVFFRSGSGDDWQAMRVQHYRTTTTDPEGHYVFDRVAPGDSWVAWEPRLKRGLSRIRHTLAEVQPGKTLTLDIGGTGRPVIGRAAVVPTNAPDQKLRWIDDRRGQTVTAMYNHVAATAGWRTPPNWAHMTRQQQVDWQRAWEETPEGKERKRHQWAEDLDLNPDGSFRIDDLVPGKYHVQVRMFHNENGFGEDLVDAGLDFTVPPLPPGQTRSDDPLDLGTIPVTLKPRALVGQLAPDFTVNTIEDNKPLKLSDFRGKYVLLKWFWSWSELDTEIPALQKAYDTIKDDPNWVLITLDFDQPLDVAKKRIADHHIPGLHAYTTQQSNAFPRAYLGSPSTLIIVGPDGKVLARNLHPENAETEIAKIHLERQ